MRSKGAIHSFDSYGSSVLIAGGIGITHSISYLRELVDGFSKGSVATRRITLLWVVRSIGTSITSINSTRLSNTDRPSAMGSALDDLYPKPPRCPRLGYVLECVDVTRLSEPLFS